MKEYATKLTLYDFISSYLAGIVNHIVTSSLSKFFNFHRQQKIYDRVWEDYHYLSKINEEEQTKKNPEKQ